MSNSIITWWMHCMVVVLPVTFMLHLVNYGHHSAVFCRLIGSVCDNRSQVRLSFFATMSLWIQVFTKHKRVAPVLRLSPDCRGSPLRHFTASEENQAWEEDDNLVSEVNVLCVCIWYVNVVFLVSCGALLLFHVELQEHNKVIVVI